MGATYTRQSTYTDGDVIQASDTNNEFNLQYNPTKYRRSYSYDPRPQKDIEKLANIKVKTRIVGETIEKTPTIFHAWLRDDESFQHFYFDYSTDGTIF